MSRSGADTWAGQSLGERIVVAAWRAVAAHLAIDSSSQSDSAEQVATGGAGVTDGVTDDALLPPPIRDRLKQPPHHSP